MQAEFHQQSLVFQEVANLQTEQDLLNHAVGQHLAQNYAAENLAINFTRGHRGSSKVLTFDIPISYKQRFPQSFNIGREDIQISHRGGVIGLHWDPLFIMNPTVNTGTELSRMAFLRDNEKAYSSQKHDRYNPLSGLTSLRNISLSCLHKLNLLLVKKTLLLFLSPKRYSVN